MKPVLIVSDRTVRELLDFPPEDSNFDITILSPDEVSSCEKPPTPHPDVLLLDVTHLQNPEELIQRLRDRLHPGLVALMREDTLVKMRELLDLDIKVYLKPPLRQETIRRALFSLQNDRKYVDPSLSNSIVDEFLD